MKFGGIKTLNFSQDRFTLSEPLKTIFIFFVLLLKIFPTSSKKFLTTNMLKSGFSKKQSKACRSACPTGSETTSKDHTPSIASSNFRAIFEDHPSYSEALRLMIKFLLKHPLYGAFNSFTEVVPLPTLFKCAFTVCRPSQNLQEIYLNLVDDSLVVLTKAKFLEAINLQVLPLTKFYSPQP